MSGLEVLVEHARTVSCKQARMQAQWPTARMMMAQPQLCGEAGQAPCWPLAQLHAPAAPVGMHGMDTSVRARTPSPRTEQGMRSLALVYVLALGRPPCTHSGPCAANMLTPAVRSSHATQFHERAAITARSARADGGWWNAPSPMMRCSAGTHRRPACACRPCTSRCQHSYVSRRTAQ